MKRILIIEDDKEINNLVTSFLSEQGYAIINAYDGLEGAALAKEQNPDIILLDIMLPYQSGDEVLKSLRLSYDTPVIVISAKSMIQTKIDLLRLGADDYITKPFDLNELLARVETILKRSSRAIQSKEDNLLTYGEIQINTFTKEVLINEKPIIVTATEFSLLEQFLTYPNKVFSKQNLYESVWKEEYAYDNDTINTHISNIRKKLKIHSDVDYIETVWGMGYKLKPL